MTSFAPDASPELTALATSPNALARTKALDARLGSPTGPQFASAAASFATVLSPRSMRHLASTDLPQPGTSSAKAWPVATTNAAASRILKALNSILRKGDEVDPYLTENGVARQVRVGQEGMARAKFIAIGSSPYPWLECRRGVKFHNAMTGTSG